MKQILKVSTKVVILCLVSVLAFSSCASNKAASGSADVARVYLVQQGPTPGQSGNFWDDLVGTVVERRPWGGTAQDSATGIFYLAADDKNLYLRAEIKDVSPSVRPPDMDPGMGWNGTSLQLFFGVKTNRRVMYTEGDSGLTIWVTHAPGAPANRRVAVTKGRPMNERQFRGAVVEWTNNSYIVEVSFSLDALEIYKPFRNGQKIRCEFRINQAAPNNGDRSYIINWRTPTDDAWHDPSVWSDGYVIQRP